MEAADQPEALGPALDEHPVGVRIIGDFLQDLQQFLRLAE